MRNISKKLVLTIILALSMLFTINVMAEEKQNNFKNIFTANSTNYSVYTDKIIDTYIIATALYFDFQSKFLLPNVENHQLYADAKIYFQTYKENEFIKSLGKYVNTDDKDINADVIHNLLLKNILSIKDMGEQGFIQNQTFQNETEFEAFKNNLYQFYNDTNAGEFFEEHSQYYKALTDYLNLNKDKIAINELFDTMENYVGNKEEYFQSANVNYMSYLTFYRPNNASFFQVGVDNLDTYFIALQSPNPYSPTDLMKFDFNKIIEDTIHESLHIYINSGVYKNNDLIMELSQDKNPKDYCSQMYWNFPWHRIVDENIVRVVETGIYKIVYSDTVKATEQILSKEILYFNKDIEYLYMSMDIYEKNRNKYKTIDDYLPELIKDLFKI